MSLMNRDTVSWNRKSHSTTDALGHPVLVGVIGFPRTVRGHFNHEGASASQNEAGLGNTISAIFVTKYTGGKVGDRVTSDGVEYIVNSTEINRSATGKIDHVRYGLSKRDLGTAEDGV